MRRLGKWKWGLQVVLTASMLLLPGFGRAAGAATVNLSVGGASTGTWIYGFSVALAEILNREVPDVKLTVISTPGSIAHYPMVERGQVQLATGSSHSDYWALHGLEMFKTKHTKARLMLPATVTVTHVFALEATDIKSMSDLNGKRVGMGTSGSPGPIMCGQILKTLDIKANMVWSSVDEMLELFKDGRVSAAMWNSGAPWSGLMDIATVKPVRLIGFTSEETKRLGQAYPYAAPGVIAKSTYGWLKADVPTISPYADWLASIDVPADTVYKLTRAAWEHWGEVVKAVQGAGTVTMADVVKEGVPIHPGAVRYYEEKGIKIPPHLK
jgi:uncharacterized protein